MIEALIAADRDCTESIDILPNKVLRPIGYVFKEWNDCPTSTDLPHWMFWEVAGYMQVFRGRRGDKLMYERCEEIKGFWLMDFRG